MTREASQGTALAYCPLAASAPGEAERRNLTVAPIVPKAAQSRTLPRWRPLSTILGLTVRCLSACCVRKTQVDTRSVGSINVTPWNES